METRRLILVSNDDGFYAKGVHALAKMAKEFGDVVLIAPERPQSGKSSALTVEAPLRIKKMIDEKGYLAYKCAGTPVDCVKMGINELVFRRPDFVLSGINHGANSSVNVFYSGTMGAALEGCISGIPSIGFSLDSHNPDVDFEDAVKYSRKIFQNLLTHGIKKGVCLNVNIPLGTIKGIKACRQASGLWQKEFVEKTDPQGKKYYWMTGFYTNKEPEAQDTDVWAMENGYVSVVPTQLDLTEKEAIPALQQWCYEI